MTEIDKESKKSIDSINLNEDPPYSGDFHSSLPNRKQVGSNPAVLNEPDGQDKYTVCGGMDTHGAEAWGPGAPLSDESAKG